VLERTVAALESAPEALLAWLGPAIGPRAFEVGVDVFDTFVATDSEAATAFQPLREGKWLADLYALARRRLARAGVSAVYGGGFCTVGDPARFFSHRRDRVTGRQAAFIWIGD
jgi:copper oxidase (laccase) domain-containing protein